MEDRIDYTDFLSEKEMEVVSKLRKEMTLLAQSIRVEEANMKMPKPTNTRLETARKTLTSKEQMLQRLIMERDMLNAQIERVSKVIETAEQTVERETKLLQTPIKSKKHIELEIKMEAKEKELQRWKQIVMQRKDGGFVSPEEKEREMARKEAAREEAEEKKKEEEERQRAKEEAEKEKKAKEAADLERQRQQRAAELAQQSKSKFVNDSYRRAWNQRQEDEYLDSLSEDGREEFEELDAAEKDNRIEDYFYRKNKTAAWKNVETEIQEKTKLGFQPEDSDSEMTIKSEEIREAAERTRKEYLVPIAQARQASRPFYTPPPEFAQPVQQDRPILIFDTKVKKQPKQVVRPR